MDPLSVYFVGNRYGVRACHLILLTVDVLRYTPWNLSGDVRAAPASALRGWKGVILLSLKTYTWYLWQWGVPTRTTGRHALIWIALSRGPLDNQGCRIGIRLGQSRVDYIYSSQPG